MTNLNPLLLVGGVIGTVTAILIFAYALVKDKKETMGFERTMKDGEILRRLAGYAKPYWAKFVVVLFLMLFSIAYDIISPLIVGALEELVAGEFALPRLFAGVAVYAGVLVFSMASTYFQAVILQRVGQRIISDLREDLFTHIESLAHEQLNEIPVGKLVTTRFNELLSGSSGSLAWYPDWPVAGLNDVLLAQTSALVQGTTSPEDAVSAIKSAYDAGKPQS